MIDFACKQFNIKDVMKCGLGLTAADFKVMNFLITEFNDFTTEDIAKKLKLNLSTVQRAVKKLHEKKIIQRNQKNLDSGGYVFVYRTESKQAIKKVILEIVKNWAKKVETELEKW